MGRLKEHYTVSQRLCGLLSVIVCELMWLIMLLGECLPLNKVLSATGTLTCLYKVSNAEADCDGRQHTASDRVAQLVHGA